MEASGEDEEGKDGAVCLDSSQSGLEVQVTGAQASVQAIARGRQGKTHCLGSRGRHRPSRRWTGTAGSSQVHWLPGVLAVLVAGAGRQRRQRDEDENLLVAGGVLFSRAHVVPRAQ